MKKSISEVVKETLEGLEEIGLCDLVTRVKVIYRRNLKMSPGKLAAQVAHAVVGCGLKNPSLTIIVLKVSDKKFNEIITEQSNVYVHQDLGHTELSPGTVTCAAWIEQEWVVSSNGRASDS